MQREFEAKVRHPSGDAEWADAEPGPKVGCRWGKQECGCSPSQETGEKRRVEKELWTLRDDSQRMSPLGWRRENQGRSRAQAEQAGDGRGRASGGQGCTKGEVVGCRVLMLQRALGLSRPDSSESQHESSRT